MKQMQLKDQVSAAGFNASVMDSRRVPLERKVVLKFHDFGGFFIEYSANVSLTGMFIRTDSPKPAGSIFIFEVWLGEDHKLVHGVGEVVWVRSEEDSASRSAGMGIRYLKIDDESRAVVQRVIAEHVEKGGEVFDLGLTGLDKSRAEKDGEERRAELSLVNAGSRPISQSDLLILDEDLLGFDSPTPEQPVEQVKVPIEAPTLWRGLRVAVLLLVLGAAMGGAAYLFSAELLPF